MICDFIIYISTIDFSSCIILTPTYWESKMYKKKFGANLYDNNNVPSTILFFKYQ